MPEWFNIQISINTFHHKNRKVISPQIYQKYLMKPIPINDKNLLALKREKIYSINGIGKIGQICAGK